jgi:hypothetical protein
MLVPIPCITITTRHLWPQSLQDDEDKHTIPGCTTLSQATKSIMATKHYHAHASSEAPKNTNLASVCRNLQRALRVEDITEFANGRPCGVGLCLTPFCARRAHSPHRRHCRCRLRQVFRVFILMVRSGQNRLDFLVQFELAPRLHARLCLHAYAVEVRVVRCQESVC